MLSYPLAWAPVFAVLAALVVLNAYLALIGIAVVAFLLAATILALLWLAAAEVCAFGCRVVRRWTGADRRADALNRS
jgi:hypothetical protein